jgi:hypothetical protein
MKNLIILLIVSFIMTSCTEQAEEKSTVHDRWSIEQTKTWKETAGWMSGCNFQPSTAINQLEMWQEETFDPETIDRELGWASELGFNMMRVYLHSYAWKQDPEGFKDRMNRYLTISRSHGIYTTFVFFDDCWNPVSKPGPQPLPKTGIHNSGWIQDPSVDLRSDTTSLYPWLEEYVKDILNTFSDDSRVVIWDLYNEPGNSGHLNKSLPLLKNVFKWAREVNPSQPLTVGIWHLDLHDLNKFQIENSDIISYHQYEDKEKHLVWIKFLKFQGRPLMCGEYMARHFNSTFQNILPMLKEEDIIAINWGFVAGKTNTIYKWDEPVTDGSEPDLWFHDILRKDGTPYDTTEIKTIRSINETI